MKLFVTVGTTCFDELIRRMDNLQVAEVLKQSGFKYITFQIGRGEYFPTKLVGFSGLEVQYYRFKPSIQEDMKEADLIISHAGAGSIMEALRLKRPLIVVINESLMDNHQLELAQAMDERGYLKFCRTSQIFEILNENKANPLAVRLKEYPPANYDLFPALLDQHMGFKK